MDFQILIFLIEDIPLCFYFSKQNIIYSVNAEQ